MTRLSFEFEFEARVAKISRLFGVTPANTIAVVEGSSLQVTFGRWRLHTELDNVKCASVAGPYRIWRIAGPARLSMSDRGVTFATTTRRGVCVEFHRPVRAIDPWGRIRHPNASVTVADPDGFVAALTPREA